MARTTRRAVLQGTAASPLLMAAGAKIQGENVYTRLGVKPLINGMGTVTVLGGSLMPPEVIAAMDEAAKYFVDLPDLQKKAGQRIAEMLKVPGAVVTGGAASGITVATVACMARGDHKKLQQLPETTGIPHEVIQQKAHRSGYEHQMTLVGAKIVPVETREDVEKAINPKTAMLFFMNKDDSKGKIKRAEWVEIGKKYNIPTFMDAAADVPPKERLWQYVQMGFDLVAFSGGKGLLGPQSAGILVGRADLTQAGQPGLSPAGGIGRGMKVGKEEIVGMVAALDRFLRVDHEAERQMLSRRVSDMMEMLKGVKGAEMREETPEVANERPHFVMEWDEAKTRVKVRDVIKQLREGEPPIAISGRGPGRLMVSVWLMQGDQHKIVARRLNEIFRSA